MKIKTSLPLAFITLHFMVQASDSLFVERYFNTSSYDSVIYYFDRLEHKASVLSDIEAVKRYEKACYYTGKTYPALKFLEKVETYTPSFSTEDQYWYYSKAGLYAWETEFLEQALYYYQKAQPIGKKLYGIRSQEFAKLLQDFGTVYHFMGNYEEAIQYFSDCREAYGFALGKDSHRYHYANSLVSQVKFTIDPNLEKYLLLMEQLKKALEKSTEYPAESKRNFWRTRHYAALIKACLRMEMPDSAYFYLNEVTDNPWGELAISMADIHKQQGRYREALEVMNGVISDFSSWGFDRSRRMADLFASKGDLYKSIGNTREALYQYDSALVLLTGEFSVDQLDITQVNCHNLWPDESLYRILKKRIELVSEEYPNSSNTELLKEQMDYYQFLVNYVNSCLSRFISDRSKLHWASRTDDTYESALNTALRLHELTNDRLYFEQAMLLANKRKYRLVTEHLRQVNVAERLNIPDSIRLAEIAAYGGLDRSTRLRNTRDLQRNEQRLASIQEAYRSDYDLAWRLKADILHDGDVSLFDQVDKSTAFVQSITQEDEIILLYHSEERDDVLRLDRKKGEELISSYITNLQKKKSSWESNSRKLYKLFLSPLIDPLDSVTNLVFVPDGMLSLIPFESLLISEKGRKFLLEKYTIRYSLNMLWPENNGRETSSLSAFAPKSDLKYQVSEVREVGRLTHGNIWIGEDATVERFEKASKHRSVIHLATHFKYDMDSYLDSYLDFGVSEGDSARLSMADIMLFQVHSDLIVLSACETGIGKMVKGEGVMSIGRSFAYSGAPNVIMSLWKVPDQSTKDLMAVFYSYVQDGYTFETALRQAKLDYLNDSDKLTSHPYFWSSMVFLGTDGRLENDNGSRFYTLIFVSLLALALVLAVRSGGSKKNYLSK